MYRNCKNGTSKVVNFKETLIGSLNLSSVLILLMIVLMTVFFLPGPVCAQPAMTDAKICETLGVLRGTGRGVTEEYLASKPQRYQAARLFLRLQGLEDEAVRYTGGANFKDVKVMPDWQFAPENKAILAYLHDHPGLGFVGYTDGTYRPFNNISAMEYYKVMLTALGYKQGIDFQWGEDMLIFAASKGLYEAAVSEFTISNLATATREALVAEVKGTGRTLLEILVEKGVIDKNAALSTGLYKEPILEVESVVANNLAEILIRFNYELDSDALKTEWFTVDGKEPVSAVIAEDRATVKIIIGSENIGSNGATYKVKVLKDAVATNGATLKETYETSLRIIDTRIPYITDVQLTGPQTIELVFSEPIKTKGTVKINGGTFGCRVEDIDGVTNRVKVHIHRTDLPEAEYNLDISGFADYAGFTMDDHKRVLSYRKDTSPITAEILEAGETTVKVRFNKAVSLKAGEEESYFYHTFPIWNPSNVLTDDNRNYTLKFTDKPIPDGTTSLTIKARGDSGIYIEDLWGNKLNSDIVLSLTVSADKTPPAVKGQAVVKTQNSIEISFTEDVAGATNKENYTVEDANGNKIDISTISYDSINYKATIYFKNDLTGYYNIIIKNIKDTSVNENIMKETVISFYVKDMTPPDHTKVEVTAIDRTGIGYKDVIYVRYPEEMAVSGEYSVLEANNYLLGGSRLPDGTELDLFGSTGRVVRITLPDASLVISGKKLTIGRVADAAGNIMQTLAISIAVSDEAPPKVTGAMQTAANKISFTVDKVLRSVEPDAFIFAISGKEYTADGIERYYIENGSTIVEVIMSPGFIRELKEKNADYGYDTGLMATDVPGVRIKIVGKHIVSETGMSALNVDNLKAGDPGKGIGPVHVKDGWKPSLRAITAENDVFVDTTEFGIGNDDDEYDTLIRIDFTESIAGQTYAQSRYYAHDLVIQNINGNTLVPAIDYITYVNAGDIFVVIPDVRIPLGQDGGRYTIETADTINYIEDASGNKINAFGPRNIE